MNSTYVVTDPTGLTHLIHWPSDPEPWSCSCLGNELTCYAFASMLHSFNECPHSPWGVGHEYENVKSSTAQRVDGFYRADGTFVDMDGKC